MSEQITDQTKDKKKAGYHHGNLREALIASAIEILEGEGLPALSLRAVARRAGVSQAAPYHHFKDKTGMLAAIAARGFAELVKAQKEVTAETDDVTGRLRALGHGYMNFGLNHPALWRLMFGPEIASPAQYPELADVASQSYRLLTDAVAAQLTPKAVGNDASKAASVAAWALVHGLTMLVMDGRLSPAFTGVETADQLIDQVTDAFARGF